MTLLVLYDQPKDLANIDGLVIVVADGVALELLVLLDFLPFPAVLPLENHLLKLGL